MAVLSMFLVVIGQASAMCLTSRSLERSTPTKLNAAKNGNGNGSGNGWDYEKIVMIYGSYGK